MGIHNVQAALAVDPEKLTPAARCTLIAMSVIAYDAPQRGVQARTYYAGWATAMMRQGFVPDDAAKRRFVRHVAELRTRGLIEILEPGRRGSNAVYRLHLPVENVVESVEDDTG
jgi:hypothetical protein